MTADLVLTGGCLCGHIRFEAKGLPEAPHTCACGMCRRHSGAPLVAWVEYPRDAVSWVGPRGQPSTWRSSPGSARAFCPICGSTLGAIDDAPVIALVTGVFDDPNAEVLAPKAHSFAGSRPPWVKVACA
ncbi:MAG: GFA family protein [Pseudomonadota bacterium]